MAGEGEKTFTQAEVDEQIAGLKTKVEELLTENKTTRARLKTFDGLDVEAARQALTELTELKSQKKAEAAGITAEQLNKLRADVRADLETEYAPFKTQAQTLASENRTLKLDNVVKGLMGKAGVRAERLDALYKLAADEFDLTEDGKPMVKSRPGKEVEKYVAEDLIKSYPEFFQGSGASGSGASRTGAATAPGTIPGEGAAFMANINKIRTGEVKVAVNP